VLRRKPCHGRIGGAISAGKPLGNGSYDRSYPSFPLGDLHL
jgi:hypothetical protein